MREGSKGGREGGRERERGFTLDALISERVSNPGLRCFGMRWKGSLGS